MFQWRPVLLAAGALMKRPKIGRAPAAAYACLPDPDLPVEMEDPYKRPIKKCILCKQDYSLDYKNARLLSQFVSPYTGRVYGRHITGLCQPMQERVADLVQKSRQFGYLAQNIKETFYLSDPALFRNPLTGPLGPRRRAAAAASGGGKGGAAPKTSSAKSADNAEEEES